MLALVSVLRTALLDEVLEVLKCTECKTKCILYIFFTPLCWSVYRIVQKTVSCEKEGIHV